MSRTARPTLNCLVERRRRGVGFRDRRRNQQRDRGKKEQPRLSAGAGPVVFLNVMLETAEQKRCAQHEQRIGDDRAGDGCLHQHVLPGAQGGQRDDQFGQVSQRGVKQAADRIARLGRDGFCGMTQQCGQRHDGQNGQHEKQRVLFGLELCGCKDDGHEHQQPQQRIVTNFFQQLFHRFIFALLLNSARKSCSRPRQRRINPCGWAALLSPFGCESVITPAALPKLQA